MIFICYRRGDSIGHTGRLHDRLVQRFGKNEVFMDIDAIEPGEDIVEAIQRTIARCDAQIVVIGKAWLTAVDHKGRRRLDNPEDFVRLEILASLDRKIRTIPVLVGGAEMPRSDELPEALVALTRRSAFELSDGSFHAGVDQLIAILEKTLKSTFESRRQQEGIGTPRPSFRGRYPRKETACSYSRRCRDRY
jgi:hypothetical protein